MRRDQMPASNGFSWRQNQVNLHSSWEACNATEKINNKYTLKKAVKAIGKMSTTMNTVRHCMMSTWRSSEGEQCLPLGSNSIYQLNKSLMCTDMLLTDVWKQLEGTTLRKCWNQEFLRIRTMERCGNKSVDSAMAGHSSACRGESWHFEKRIK